jgi:short-subunit dehydrogenase
LSIARSNSVFLPILLAQGSGHIVNVASFAGIMTYSFDRLPYAASKAAIFQLSEGLALYLRPKGIGVTVLCPGPVATNIMQSTKVWTDGVQLRGPGAEFGLMTIDQVGRQVVEAILADRFFLPTHPEVRERLIRRAQEELKPHQEMPTWPVSPRPSPNR